MTTTDANAPSVQPGWYADPTQPSLLRYFDGTSWTEATMPALGAPSPGTYSAPNAAPQTPAPARSRFGLGIVIGAVLGLAAGALGAFLVLAASSSWSGGVESLGESALVDEIYALCTDGDMVACDLLYYEAAAGSELEDFSQTCGRRTDNPDNEYCTVLDPDGDDR